MSSLFEDLKEGLQEAIDFEKGNGKAKTTTYIIDPVRSYSNVEISRSLGAWKNAPYWAS